MLTTHLLGACTMFAKCASLAPVWMFHIMMVPPSSPLIACTRAETLPG